MADDVPETEATSTAAAALKLARPSSPVQKINSNAHNAVDGNSTTTAAAMSHLPGTIKRIRSLDADDQEVTSNSSSPKRPRLAEEEEDGAATNCKSPKLNNKEIGDEAPSSNGKEVKDHLTSNGALSDSKDTGDTTPIDSIPKDNGDETSIDRASDADVSSQAKCVEKENGSSEDESSSKNGAPSEEHLKDATAASLSSEDHNGPLESNSKSTLVKDCESNSERTGSSSDDKPGGDEACDTNAKESSDDKVIPKGDQEDEEEERMEVDGEDSKDTTVSNSKENGVEDVDSSPSSSSKEDAASEIVDKEDTSANKRDNSETVAAETKTDGSEKDTSEATGKDEGKKDAETGMDTSEKDDAKEGKKSSDNDIIVLSSDDSAPEAVEVSHSTEDTSSRTSTPAPEPTDPLGELSEEQLQNRDAIIKRLNEDLRNEEAKLLLLKKLRQSQQQPVPTEPKEPEDPNNVADASKIIGRNQQLGSVPPPLVPGPGQLKPHLSNQSSQLAQQQRLQMPQLIRGGNLQQSGHHGNSSAGPPPLVLARGGISNLNTLQQVQQQQQQQQQMNRNQMIRMISTSHITQTSNSLSTAHGRVSSTNSAQETQSAASRQAAAKLALRKQLEKTLLQIPPPKPPPPELHFLPSAANNEFIILVGLEEVVNVILDLEKKDKSKKDPKYLAPFKCAQCKTDFTTIWKQGSKQGIMCENCIVSNQKKALKAEHTNRLKTAFVKALQQEQEIEQRMQHTAAQQAAASINIPKVTHKVKQVNKVQVAHGHSSHHGIQVMQQQQQQQQHSRQRVMNPAPTQRTMQPVTYAYIPQVSGVNIAGIQMIPKQQFVAGHHGIVTASDRQREYLLDMISNKSGSSISGWKR